MKIEVFKKDIEEGIQEDCHNCVLAKALCRIPFPEGAVYVSVSHRDFIYQDQDGEEIGQAVKWPRHVTQYIRRFDKNKKHVLPTVFNV